MVQANRESGKMSLIVPFFQTNILRIEKKP